MAQLEAKPAVVVDITIRLTEEEARALYAITLYGPREFLDVFYKHLGAAYLRRHEGGLLSLFHSVERILPGLLKMIDDSRAIFRK